MAVAGRVLMMPRGAFDESITYELLDVVNHKGTSWVAKKTVVGIEPSEENGEYWHCLLDVQDTSYVTPQMFGAKGDGVTNDSSAVLSAIEHGGVIVCNGTYLIGEVKINKDCTIVGNGTFLNGQLTVVDEVSVNIEGVTFKDSNGYSIYCYPNSNLNCKNLIFDGCAKEKESEYTAFGTLYTKEANTLTLDNCYFTGCNGISALYIYGLNHLYVNNCKFINNKYRAIQISGDIKPDGYINNCHIEGCGYGNDGDGVACNGMYIHSPEMIVENCVIKKCRENAIEGAFKKVSNCYIEETGWNYKAGDTDDIDGIYVNADCDCEISNNTLKNIGRRGIISVAIDEANTSNQKIVNNIVGNCGVYINQKYAIYILASNNSVRNKMVLDNICEGDVYIGNYVSNADCVYKGDSSKLLTPLYSTLPRLDREPTFRNDLSFADNTVDSKWNIGNGDKDVSDKILTITANSEYTSKLYADILKNHKGKFVVTGSIRMKGKLNSIELRKNNADVTDLLPLLSEKNADDFTIYKFNNIGLSCDYNDVMSLWIYGNGGVGNQLAIEWVKFNIYLLDEE